MDGLFSEQRRHASVMTGYGAYLVIPAALLWFAILLLSWRAWNTREKIDANPRPGAADLSDISVLIPARNEAGHILDTLNALARQGGGLKAIVIDDCSSDRTADAARQAALENLTVIHGKPRPVSWSGKLWALEQGLAHVHTPLTLLMDADIELEPGILATLRDKMQAEGIGFISLMAAPRLDGFWERLMMPAFVYFFKLLYPFYLSNSENTRVAAAGGVILLETRLLNELGGFSSLKAALIDDCALARKARESGFKTWIGLTHSARIRRQYNLRTIIAMISRTAFTQLHYSIPLLLLCTLLMVIAFWLPVAGLFFPGMTARGVCLIALIFMTITYSPVLRFYRSGLIWGLTLPLAGMLYLSITWISAFRYWCGERSRWKGRIYHADGIRGL